MKAFKEKTFFVAFLSFSDCQVNFFFKWAKNYSQKSLRRKKNTLYYCFNQSS